MARLEVRFPANKLGLRVWTNPNLLKAKFIRVWQIGGLSPNVRLPQSAFEIILLLHP